RRGAGVRSFLVRRYGEAPGTSGRRGLRRTGGLTPRRSPKGPVRATFCPKPGAPMFAFRFGDGAELRLIEERHPDALHALVRQNYARLRAWVPWLEKTATVESTRAFIRRRLQRMADNNGWAAGIWFRGALAGEIGLDYIDWANRFTEIGYWVGEAFEGKG